MSNQYKEGAQEAMQKFGRFLSGMVLPNIGAFIAWGLLTALFIPTGWWPNEYLAQVGAPMSKWLIPLLLGYSGGAAIYGHRGGVLGTIATAGVIAGSDIPMFLGAMIMGPLGGWVIKKFDKAIEDHIPTGFEMLVNNFSAGIIGGILAILAFVAIGPIVLAANGVLRAGVEGIVAMGLLPLASIIIEPAKVLFEFELAGRQAQMTNELLRVATAMASLEIPPNSLPDSDTLAAISTVVPSMAALAATASSRVATALARRARFIATI